MKSYRDLNFISRQNFKFAVTQFKRRAGFETRRRLGNFGASLTYRRGYEALFLEKHE